MGSNNEAWQGIFDLTFPDSVLNWLSHWMRHSRVRISVLSSGPKEQTVTTSGIIRIDRLNQPRLADAWMVGGPVAKSLSPGAKGIVWSNAKRHCIIVPAELIKARHSTTVITLCSIVCDKARRCLCIYFQLKIFSINFFLCILNCACN